MALVKRSYQGVWGALKTCLAPKFNTSDAVVAVLNADIIYLNIVLAVGSIKDSQKYSQQYKIHLRILQ